MAQAYVGAPLRRREDPRLLRGQGRFLPDVPAVGTVHAAILRSQHAHARLRRLELSACREAPGVLAAIGPEDIGPVGPIPIRMGDRPALHLHRQLPLARGEARYVGEPLAVVVARTRYEAEDALQLAQIELEPLPVVVETAAGRAVDELAMRHGDAAAAFARAATVVEGRFRLNRQTGAPLETRGLLAEWDAAPGRLTVWGPTKVAHTGRRVLAGLLGLPEAAIRFIEPDVGGGFGVRGEFYPEDFLIPWLALRLGRPVRWVEDRRENLAATNHSREVVCDAALALDAAGRMTALRCEAWYDMGAYVRTHGALVPENLLAALPGPYAIAALDLRAHVCLTNKTPVGTYRGPGHFEAAFVRERLVDLAARRLGADPAELRLRNLVPPGAAYEPGTESHGRPVVYEPGDYAALLRRSLEAFGYREARPRPGVGVGIGCFVEKSAAPGWEYARVAVDPSGRVTVYAGGAAVGQGLETSLAQICADALGADLGEVDVRHGDTDLVPFGVGSFGSRTMALGGAAVAEAAARVRARALQVAAEALEAPLADLVLERGAVRLRGVPGRGLTLGEIAALCQPGPALAAGREPGLEAAATWESRLYLNAFGVHLAEVAVDEATGEVRVLRELVAYDSGRVVNPLLLDGQLVGAAAQGLGGTLCEELRYDGTGQLLSGSLMDYLLPTAAEVPRVATLAWEGNPSAGNPLGVRGAGEAGITGAPGAIANAVAAALGGTAGLLSLPLAPEAVWLAARQG